MQLYLTFTVSPSKNNLEEKQSSVQEGSIGSNNVGQKKTLQTKQSKVPALDLTKAVASATNANNQGKANAPRDEINEPGEVRVIEKQNKAPTLSDAPYEYKGNEVKLNVSPDIFVSLKKGLINDYYKIGKTLGEGK